jgi:hypothetical protein
MARNWDQRFWAIVDPPEGEGEGSLFVGMAVGLLLSIPLWYLIIRGLIWLFDLGDE